MLVAQRGGAEQACGDRQTLCVVVDVLRDCRVGSLWARAVSFWCAFVPSQSDRGGVKRGIGVVLCPRRGRKRCVLRCVGVLWGDDTVASDVSDNGEVPAVIQVFGKEMRDVQAQAIVLSVHKERMHVTEGV